MADINKYTAKEALNKVIYNNASINTYALSEGLNTVLDDANDRLNIRLEGGTVDGNLIITGGLTVEGATTVIESTTLSIDDKNIDLASTDTPSDATADGGGITLKGTSDKTILWDNTNDNWTFNQAVNIATGLDYKINNVSVLNATTLGSGVTASSLTSVGILDLGSITSGFGNIDIGSSTFDTTGAVTMGGGTFSGTLTVGADEDGHDVTLYGTTTGRYMLWDESADTLILADNTAIKLGTGSDLALYHTGTHSYIDHSNSGELYIRNLRNSGDILFKTKDGSGNTMDVATFNSVGNVGIGDSSPSEAKLSITGVASGDAGIKIDQDQNNYALEIDSEATTAASIYIAGNAATTTPIIMVDDADALTTGNILKLYSNASNTDGRNLVYIINDNPLSTGATCLKIDQDANQSSIIIDSEATDQDVLSIGHAATTTGNIVAFTGCDSLTSGTILRLESDGNDGTARNLAEIVNDNSGGDADAAVGPPE